MSRLVVGIDPSTTGGAAVLIAYDTTGRAHFRERHDGDTDSVVNEVATWIAGFQCPHHEPPIVAVEAPQGFIHEHARGAALIETAKVAGRLEGRFSEMGFIVLTASAQVWRKALCGQGNASDGQVKQMCRIRIQNLPARSNAHIRDALGVAVWAAETWRIQRRTA